MMKHAFWSLLFLLMFSGGAAAQTTPAKGYDVLSAKLLLTDYGYLQQEYSYKKTFGLELMYRRQFNRTVGLAIPVKVGVLDIGRLENPNFLSGDVLLNIFPFGAERFLSPYLLGGIGLVGIDFEGGHVQLPFGGGINIRLGENSFLGFEGQYRHALIDQRENLHVSAGYVYRLTSVDRDKDGVADREDQCPDLAGPADLQGCPDADGDGIADRADICPTVPGLASLQGCPDADGDGVTDADDKCPDIAGTLQGCPDADGDQIADKDDACPDEAGTAELDGCPDTDGDGLADKDDECPTEAGTVERRGCPVRDRDGDGVPDEEDRCPDAAGTFDGCPDTDGDGVMDADDRCPQQPGTAENKGCPEIKAEVKKVLEFATRAVQFETGKATLKAESHEVLNQIAEIMKEYTAYSLVISGHTDSVGDDEANQILSEERAKASLQYLVSRGISPDRMSFEGYGETKPRASNKKASGRALNRRVEFELKLL